MKHLTRQIDNKLEVLYLYQKHLLSLYFYKIDKKLMEITEMRLMTELDYYLLCCSLKSAMIFTNAC